MGLYHLQGGIHRSHHGWCLVRAPEWPSMSESTDNLPIVIVPGAPPPEDTPDEETIDSQTPDHTCTPDRRKTKSYRQAVVVGNAGGKAYGKAAGVYNKHRKYSEQWNPWHLFQCTHTVQQAQSFRQHTKTSRGQHPRRGLDKVNFESFQSPYALRKLLSERAFRLGDETWFEDHSPIFGTLYYWDISNFFPFLWAHLPFEACLDATATRDCGRVPAILYSRLATRLRTLAIILPIHQLTITRVHVSNRIHIFTKPMPTRPNTGVGALTLPSYYR